MGPASPGILGAWSRAPGYYIYRRAEYEPDENAIFVPNFDAIIVGGGPAGLNAALVLARCRRSVLVCDQGRPRNAASASVHNFLTRDGIAPLELLRLARAEIGGYGVHFYDGAVLDAHCGDNEIEIVLEDGRSLTARKILLATGVRDVLPDVPGLKELYGHSVHHCAYCDGYKWRDRPIAAFGDAKAAVGLGLNLRSWTESVLVCTNGGPLPGRRDRQRIRHLNLIFRPEKIVRLEGADGLLQRIVFDSGSPYECCALFFNTAQTQRSPLPEKLGCRFDKNGHVCTDRRGRTGICNLFLAGDADGDVQFAIVAAAEGAQAGVAIHRELQDEDCGLG